MRPRCPFRQAVKRVLDLGASLVALILLAPVMLVLAVLVRIHLGAPIFFRQTRQGLLGKLFTILKFRTMTDATGPTGELLPDEERLTPFGRFLRATSLDELPELFNVLRGDMSLVGPRPLLTQYEPLYSPTQRRRFEVPPGITGWAQVNGRNLLSWEKKFALDVWYVDHWSLCLDFFILWRTLLVVLRCQGVSAEEHATAPTFKGST